MANRACWESSRAAVSYGQVDDRTDSIWRLVDGAKPATLRLIDPDTLSDAPC